MANASDKKQLWIFNVTVKRLAIEILNMSHWSIIPQDLLL